MKTLRLSILPLLLVSGFFLQGCATDIAGKAEQTTKIATINFRDFVRFERANEAQLMQLNPGIHQLATKLRHKECSTCDQNDIRWLETARNFTETYRLNRTADNKVQLQTAIAVIQTALDEITQYFLTPGVSALDPVTASKYRKTKVIQ